MFTPFIRNRTYAPHSDEEMTHQGHKAECDIYEILKQYQRTGVLTHVAQAKPRFDDLPEDLDYQAALHQVMAANAAFDALPASVRDEFRNDPGTFLAAFQDPTKEDRLRELGLLVPRPAAPPAPAGSEPG